MSETYNFIGDTSDNITHAASSMVAPITQGTGLMSVSVGDKKMGFFDNLANVANSAMEKAGQNVGSVVDLYTAKFLQKEFGDINPTGYTTTGNPADQTGNLLLAQGMVEQAREDNKRLLIFGGLAAGALVLFFALRK